jgi:hypothetical protein
MCYDGKKSLWRNLMARNIPLFVAFILTTIFTFNIAVADVLIEDVNIESQTSQNVLFTDVDFPTGSGSSGDYLLVACAVSSANGGSVFSTPSPPGWTLIDSGFCGGAGTCSLSVWGKFTDNPANDDVVCSWFPGANVFAASALRYSNVDTENPIIDSACDNGADFGVSVSATAPSVTAEAGSQWAAFWAYRNFNQDLLSNEIFDDDLPFIAEYIATGQLTFVNLSLFGSSDLVEEDTTIVPVSVNAGLDAEWRACAVTLRMGAGGTPRNVPTMNEWGLMAFAAFAGISAIWYLRRRQSVL